MNGPALTPGRARPASLLGTLLALALGGCAALPPVLLSGAVGPAPLRARPGGDLVVYSATRTSMSEQSEYPVHTDYVLYDAHGTRLRSIANSAGAFGADPVRLALPAGAYEVRALEQNAGYVIVPVQIERGAMTVVDLDGSALPQDVADPDLLRLPDGHIVGWRTPLT